MCEEGITDPQKSDFRSAIYATREEFREGSPTARRQEEEPRGSDCLDMQSGNRSQTRLSLMILLTVQSQIKELEKDTNNDENADYHRSTVVQQETKAALTQAENRLHRVRERRWSC